MIRRLHTFRAATLALVAAMLPFETLTGALQVGGMTLTWLEMALVACAAAQIAALVAARVAPATGERGASLGRRHWPRRWRAHSGFGAWVGLFLGFAAASAVLTPDLNGPAAKSAARLAVDALVGLAALGVVRRPPVWLPTRRLLGILVGAATGAALLGIAEQQVGDGAAVELFLRHFREKATLAGGVRRLTGTFAQANISAAFFATMVPLSLALAVVDHGEDKPTDHTAPTNAAMPSWQLRGVGLWPWRAAAGVLLWALLGTYSRGAIVASLVVGAAGLGWQIATSGTSAARRRCVWIGVALAAVVVLRLAVDPALRSRVGLPPRGPQMAATLTVVQDIPGTSSASRPAERRVALALRNTGWLRWRAGGSDPMRLVTRTLNPQGDAVGVTRTRLPHDVQPGQQLTLASPLPQSDAADGVWVHWQIEQHGLRSYDTTPPTIRLRSDLSVDVAATARAALTRARPTTAADAAGPLSASRAELWPLALRRWRARPWFGWGADTFRLRWHQDAPALRADPRMHANSLWLELLADLGMLGTLAFVVVIGGAVRSGLRGHRVGSRPGADAPKPRIVALGDPMIRLAATVAMTTWIMHGAVDCALFFHGPATLFWIAAGLAYAASAPRASSQGRPTRQASTRQG